MTHLLQDRAFRGALQEMLGPGVAPGAATPVGGGCIHAAYRLDTASGPFFLKVASAGQGAMLAAEADGLAALAASGSVRVPAVFGRGVHAGAAWLLLEWFELKPLDARAGGRLGEALAALHRLPQPACGWPRDNFIGTTPQPNAPSADWIAFLRDRRLGFQLGLAASRGLLPVESLRCGDCLLDRLSRFFPGGVPQPALLHGDLWGGNAAQTTAGEPVIFDPAVYRGDPEADLAMTTLFGGFPPAFHAAYAAANPPRPGADRRRKLYQLYHVLNHLNLFGGSYAAQAERMILELAGSG